MKIKRLLTVLLLLTVALSLVACNVQIAADEAKIILDEALKTSFAADSAYITIKEYMSFQSKDSKGNPRFDKDSNPIMRQELVTTAKVQTYLSKSGDENSRITYIEISEYDTLGDASTVSYWAGKQTVGSKNDKTEKQFLYKKYYDKEKGKTVYERQEIKNLNIFDYAEFSDFDKKNLLSSWYNLKSENYTFVKGSKNGMVDNIVVKINSDYDKKLSDLGDISIRLTNGKLTSISAEETQGNSVLIFKNTVTKYKIDYLLEGAYISLPDGDSIIAEINKNKESNNIFNDNAAIVKEA